MQMQSDCHVLVTSNEPASAHLLLEKLRELAKMATMGEAKVAFNNRLQTGLSILDVRDFASTLESYSSSWFSLPEIPFDNSASMWIGTQNTLYTEGSKRTQASLCDFVRCLLDGNKAFAPAQEYNVKSLFSSAQKLLSWRKLFSQHKNTRCSPPELSSTHDFENIHTQNIGCSSKPFSLPAPGEVLTTNDDSSLELNSHFVNH
jgi:hypothetical protein